MHNSINANQCAFECACDRDIRNHGERELSSGDIRFKGFLKRSSLCEGSHCGANDKVLAEKVGEDSGANETGAS